MICKVSITDIIAESAMQAYCHADVEQSARNNRNYSRQLPVTYLPFVFYSATNFCVVYTAGICFGSATVKQFVMGS